MPIGTLGDLGCSKKTVLLRLDLNSPIDPTSHLILDDKRFREHLPTIRALSDSRVVIVTHQSRPGKKDFTTLEAHAGKLEELLGTPVTYIDSIFGSHAKEAVHAMKARRRPDARERAVCCRREPHHETRGGQKDPSRKEALRDGGFLCQRRIRDCPPVPADGCRPAARHEICGRPPHGKGGSTLSKVFSGAPRPVCMVLGGTKVDDSIEVAGHVLENGIADTRDRDRCRGQCLLYRRRYDIGKPSTQLVGQAQVPGRDQKGKGDSCKVRRPGDHAVIGCGPAERQAGRVPGRAGSRPMRR